MKTFISTCRVCMVGLFLLSPLQGFSQNISTYAGCYIGNDSLAIKAEMAGPYDVAVDNSGNVYIADYDNDEIRIIGSSGIITAFAGIGIYGHTGDGGPAANAYIGNIYGIAFDRAGNLYLSDVNHGLIRKVSTAGIITDIAGVDDATGYNGDNIPATLAKFYYPLGLAVDTAGNIYVADEDNSRVRMINASTGIITTIAGTGSLGFSGMGGPATAAKLRHPDRLAFDKAGNLYIADGGSDHICKVDTAGVITNFAGSGTYGYTGDGGPAINAEISAPLGLAIDTSGNVYFSDYDNSVIRMISATTGVISTVCGNGTAGFSGDGGPALSAELSAPRGLNFDQSGNLLISDVGNNTIRILSPTGTINTLAGRNGFFGEGYAALNAEISYVQNIATDAAGNLYIPDDDNERIRKVNAATGIITTVAGAGISGQIDSYSGDGGPATDAHIYFPQAVALDGAGNLYISDGSNQRIRKVSPSGIITTVAGNGTEGYSGDGGQATDAELYLPAGITVDKYGNIYIADRDNSVIRKVDNSGNITTIAGNNTAGYMGDGSAAIAAELNYPSDVAVDGSGNIYIADVDNNVIRMIDTSGIISTIAGNGAGGFSGDGGLAIGARLDFPRGIKVDSAGDIIIADQDNNRIRVVDKAGIIYTIAGNGTIGYSGDGGPATDAALAFPSGVAFDNSGNLFIADIDNRRIRKTNLANLAVPQVNAAVQNIFAYPNPTVGMVYIANAANGTFVLNDILGWALMSGTISLNRQALDLSALPGGVYLLQITSSNGENKMEKIIKE